MALLTVPMDPSYLPELTLIIAGLATAGAAIVFAFARRFGHALRAGAASVVSVALVFLLAKTTHPESGAPELLSPGATSSTSLVLGGVVLRVAPADRYALWVSGTKFLDLDLRQRGLAVTGVVGANDHAAARLETNQFPRRWSDVRPYSPDAHTLVLTGQEGDIFRVQYAEPRRIEVNGQFFGLHEAPALISLEKGIRWGGGAIAPGTIIDLRDQGAGRIDFGPSGEVRILPAS